VNQAAQAKEVAELAGTHNLVHRERLVKARLDSAKEDVAAL
jgi:hypothetical protein